jgi:4-amino-4-deoxy-L-arabinose transferase-like glycosyltransferase
LALGLSAVLVLLVLARAACLGGEYYDAYETRAAGRVLAGLAEGAVPVYRSPVMVVWSALWESLGLGWRAPALLSALSYSALVGLVIALARTLGARPWVAASCGLLVALDRLAFAYAPHGLPGVLTAAACTGAMLVALRPVEGAWPGRLLGLGVLIGLAALLRPNAGLVGVALLAGLARPSGRRPLDLPLVRLVLVGALALAVYGVVSTGVHAWARGSLDAGLASHGDLTEFHRLQMAENRERYGSHAPAGAYLLSLAVASPWLVLLAPLGVALGWGQGRPARVVAAWAGVHLLFLHTLVGHVEARYLLPALGALGALAAFPLSWADARLRSSGQRVAAVCLLAAVPLALGARYEARRALDPATRESFPARVAAEARALGGDEARYLWTTTHLYPVAPAVVLAEGSPYPGDPFHGIYHAGPVVVGYHLGQPISMLADAGAGLVEVGSLEAFLRQASGFRAGDVLLVGRDGLSAHWHLAVRPPETLRLLRVTDGPQGRTLEAGRALVPAGQPADNRPPR